VKSEQSSTPCERIAMTHRLVGSAARDSWRARIARAVTVTFRDDVGRRHPGAGATTPRH